MTFNSDTFPDLKTMPKMRMEETLPKEDVESKDEKNDKTGSEYIYATIVTVDTF